MLILNAGVFGAGHEITEDGIERTFQVNHLSHFLLVQLLEKRLLTSAPARVIVLSSESHRQSFLSRDNISEEYLSPSTSSRFVPMIAYNDTKLCNVLFASQLNKRLSRHKVFASSVHPGNMVNTNISRNWWFYRLLFTLVRPFTKSVVSRLIIFNRLQFKMNIIHLFQIRNKERQQPFMLPHRRISKKSVAFISTTVVDVLLPNQHKTSNWQKNCGPWVNLSLTKEMRRLSSLDLSDCTSKILSWHEMLTLITQLSVTSQRRTQNSDFSSHSCVLMWVFFRSSFNRMWMRVCEEGEKENAEV